MNNKKRFVFSIGLLSLSVANCFAETKAFIEINQLDFSDSRLEAKPTALSFGGEYVFSKRYSVLAKIGTNIQSDQATTESEQVEVKLSSLYGIYFKSYMSQSSKMNLFATVGFTKTNLSGDFSAGKLSQSDSGLSLGIGLEYQLKRNIAAGINYNNMFDGSESKMSSINFSLSYAF
jgi:opacity protein-like surface antigen